MFTLLVVLSCLASALALPTPDGSSITVRESRGLKECRIKCAKYGFSPPIHFDCLSDCLGRSIKFTPENVEAPMRQARVTQASIEKCKDNCIKEHGHSFMTAPCQTGCYYGRRRSLEYIPDQVVRQARAPVDACKSNCEHYIGLYLVYFTCLNNCNGRMIKDTQENVEVPYTALRQARGHKADCKKTCNYDWGSGLYGLCMHDCEAYNFDRSLD